jgi:hypothetical protein
MLKNEQPAPNELVSEHPLHIQRVSRKSTSLAKSKRKFFRKNFSDVQTTFCQNMIYYT